MASGKSEESSLRLWERGFGQGAVGGIYAGPAEHNYHLQQSLLRADRHSKPQGALSFVPLASASKLIAHHLLELQSALAGRHAKNDSAKVSILMQVWRQDLSAQSHAQHVNRHVLTYPACLQAYVLACHRRRSVEASI